MPGNKDLLSTQTAGIKQHTLQKQALILREHQKNFYFKLKKFENAIKNGELLVLLDIPMDRIGEITQKIIKHHPNAEFEGIEQIFSLSY
jgi:hypothetical protein